MSATVKTIDHDGTEWTATGEVVFGGVMKEGKVEVDFSKCTAKQLALMIATILVIAQKTDPAVARAAINLYQKRI